MTPRSRAGRPLTEAEIRQRTEAGRKSHATATEQPTSPGANDGQVRSVPLWSAAVARLNARPLVMVPYPQPVQTMTTAQEARRRRGA